MHVQSIGPDGLFYGWDNPEQIPQDHRRLSDEEIEARVNPPLTEEQLRELFSVAIQSHMDQTAQAAGYDDIKAAVTYADEPAVPRFQAEGQAFRAWRSRCWAYGYEQLAKVKAGDRPQPTIEQFLEELPLLDLPQQ